MDFLIEFEPGQEPSLLELAVLQEQLVQLVGRPVGLSTPSILENPYRRRAILSEIEPVYAA